MKLHRKQYIISYTLINRKMDIKNLSLEENLQFTNYRPIYSPRSAYALYQQQILNNKTNIVINIDQQVLSLFKNIFQENNNRMGQIQFIYEGLKLLKSWQKNLSGRQTKMIKYLNQLYMEASQKQLQVGKKDVSKKQNYVTFLTWQNFNKMIIQKALNLKSLQTHETENASFLKPTTWKRKKQKLPSCIAKSICLHKQKKFVYLCEESNKIQFLSLYNNQHTFKPITIDKKQITVQKSLVRRVKDSGLISQAKPVKENYKKDVLVSSYKIVFLDMIYISNQKYRMLLTSSSDCIVRGWDIHGNTGTLAKQPQSQEQKMIHQFPTAIHCMVWDQINQILYCSGKNSKIYLWMVKTDSERELTHPDGHTTMISSMIMMPKLQFLASGGYDGNLILWDTISLNIKFKYTQHTRSIVSMTFHEGLILLFTAAFDHSICVWNPYIPSLIYKIPCNLNVIQISIIPGTNYLAALDSGSNMKIRQVNKFTLISSYMVDRPEQINQQNNKQIDQQEQQNNLVKQNHLKIDPGCMSISQSPVRFFFCGNSIKCLEFDENQALMASDYQPSFLKYSQVHKNLYVTLKNNIMVWDLLTGRLINILSRQTDNQITAIDFLNDDEFIIGDLEGSIFIRNIENGIKIQKLYESKMRSPIMHLKTKDGGIWNQSVIIGCTMDSQIVVFGKDKSKDYLHLRTLQPKKYLQNINMITALDYEEKRNILIIGCNSGDILFMDVDKTKVTNHIQQQQFSFHSQRYEQSLSNPEITKLEVNHKIPCVMGINRGNQLYAIYLPPHSKKFKPFFDVYFSKTDRITTVQVSKLSNSLYFGYENGLILKMDIDIDKDQQQNRLIEKWEIKLQDNIKTCILLQKQSILAAIVFNKNIVLISTQNGEILDTLPSHGLVDYNLSILDQSYVPLSYFNQQQSLILDIASRQKNKLTNLDSIRVHHDPFYLCKLLKNKHKLSSQITLGTSNKKWKIFPQFQDQIENNIKNISEIQQKIQVMKEDFPKRKLNRKTSFTNSIDKAHQLQNKWEIAKQQQQQKNIQNTRLLKIQSFGLKTLKPSENRMKIVYKKKDQQRRLDDDININNIKQISGLKHQSLHKMESSPLFKLGLALKNIDDKDKKANKFIQLAIRNSNGGKDKKDLKFPKIKQSKY